jgi:hypothetical protein
MRGFLGRGSARLGVTNNVAIATTSTAVASAAFGSDTYQIRIAALQPAYFKVGTGTETPTASASDALLLGTQHDYVTVSPSQKISFFSPTIQTVSVVELTQ